MKQQNETLEYFRTFAQQWRDKAEGMARRVNIIEQRHDFGLAVAREIEGCERSLDVGCGTGELVLGLASMGVNALGVDFAPEMIALCTSAAKDAGADNARFETASIFEFTPSGDQPFDLISANGFIEYVSADELDRFLTLARQWLSPQGALVLGSRNRLYNAFSLNDYTRMEREAGAFEALIEESLLISGADTMADCLAALAGLELSLPTMAAHPSTGIDVTTRHQYTPAELVQRVAAFGFEATELYPVHYHGASPRFRSEHPEAHVAVATLMQGFARGTHALIPSASSFMLSASLSHPK